MWVRYPVIMMITITGGITHRTSLEVKLLVLNPLFTGIKSTRRR